MKKLSKNDLLNEKERSHFEDIEKFETCKDPAHNPPSHLHIPQGKRYIHICPSCGDRKVITPLQIGFTVVERENKLIQAVEEVQGKNYDFTNRLKKEIETKVPIRKGCPNSQCYCNGECQKIIGWRNKTPLEISQERINRPKL